MTHRARHLAAVAQLGMRGRAVSSGVSSGENSAVFSAASRFDPDAYRRAFPERWTAFLHEHHRDSSEVSFFYGVTDRAARDWWEGRSSPRGAPVAMAADHNPTGFARIILGRVA